MTTHVVAIDRNSIKNRGEVLHETIWQGRQWAVTEYGIEARDGTYHFEAERLSETRLYQGNELPEWPLHLAEKTWVDIHDFCTAFMVALAYYPEFAKFNGSQIRKAVQIAIHIKERTEV